jgi:aconitate hydratase
VLPCQFKAGESAESIGLNGRESFEITGLEGGAAREAKVIATAKDGNKKEFMIDILLATPKEQEFLRHGGILPYVLRQLAKTGKPA